METVVAPLEADLKRTQQSVSAVQSKQAEQERQARAAAVRADAGDRVCGQLQAQLDTLRVENETAKQELRERDHKFASDLSTNIDELERERKEVERELERRLRRAETALEDRSPSGAAQPNGSRSRFSLRVLSDTAIGAIGGCIVGATFMWVLIKWVGK